MLEELGRDPDEGGENSERAIDVQITRLRRKLEADAENPQIIKSVRGAGYIFIPPVAAVR